MTDSIPTPACDTTRFIGDANMDCRYTDADVTVLDYYIGKVKNGGKLSHDMDCICDINMDGNVDNNDKELLSTVLAAYKKANDKCRDLFFFMLTNNITTTTKKYNERFIADESIIAAATAQSTITYGDANCDGKVDMGDSVLIMQSICDPAKFGVNGTEPNRITEEGYKNADCYNVGDGVTSADALAIQKFTLSLIPSLPENE